MSETTSRSSANKKSFMNANFQGQDLKGKDFSCADLRNTNLQSADLRRADIFGADLRCANLKQADLRGADCQGVDFEFANLRGTNFHGASLRYASLRGAFNIDQACGLESFKADIWMVLTFSPQDAKGVIGALRSGCVDRSIYKLLCKCLVDKNTQQCHRSCQYVSEVYKDTFRPAEEWFRNIHSGNTPENCKFVALTLTWIEEWMKVAGNDLAAAFEARLVHSNERTKERIAEVIAEVTGSTSQGSIYTSPEVQL